MSLTKFHSHIILAKYLLNIKFYVKCPPASMARFPTSPALNLLNTSLIILNKFPTICCSFHFTILTSLGGLQKKPQNYFFFVHDPLWRTKLTVWLPWNSIRKLFAKNVSFCLSSLIFVKIVSVHLVIFYPTFYIFLTIWKK